MLSVEIKLFRLFGGCLISIVSFKNKPKVSNPLCGIVRTAANNMAIKVLLAFKKDTK